MAYASDIAGNFRINEEVVEYTIPSGLVGTSPFQRQNFSDISDLRIFVTFFTQRSWFSVKTVGSFGLGLVGFKKKGEANDIEEIQEYYRSTAARQSVRATYRVLQVNGYPWLVETLYNVDGRPTRVSYVRRVSDAYLLNASIGAPMPGMTVSSRNWSRWSDGLMQVVNTIRIEK